MIRSARALLPLGLAVLFATATPAAHAGPADGAPPVRWAIVIGISEYADSAIDAPAYADDDAWALADFFSSPAAGEGAVAPENLTLLTNGDATGRNIRHALITFLRRAEPEDVITVFFAGQSVTDPERPEDVYLLPYDAELDHVIETGLPITHVFHALDQAYGYQKIFLADVSHSRWIQHDDRRGILPNPVNQQLLNGSVFVGPRYVALTASEPGKSSFESQRWGGGHGAFTHYLLEGLRGAADRDRDGFVRLGELIAYTRERVRMATDNAQLPTPSAAPFDAFWVMAGAR